MLPSEGLDNTMEGNSAHSEAAPRHPLMTLHMLLRGRYWLALVLAAGGMLVGAPIGFKAMKPSYRAEARVQVEAYKVPVINDTYLSSMIPMFDSYMESQIEALRSPSVVKLAMEDLRWKELGRPATPDAVDGFIAKLEINRRGENIWVAYVDTQPQTTDRAVNSLVDAYQRWSTELENTPLNRNLKLLAERRAELESNLKSLNAQVNSLSNEYGTEAMDQMVRSKLDDLSKATSQVTLTKLALLAAEAEIRDAGINARAGEPNAPKIVKVGADELQQYLNARREMERDILRMRLEYGEQHQKVIRAQNYLAMLDDEIKNVTTEAQRGGTTVNGAMSSVAVEKLRREVANIVQYSQELEQSARALSAKNQQIKQIQAEANMLASELSDVKKKMDTYEMERTVGPRVSVQEYGDAPRGKFKDRRIPVAAAAGFGGAGLGVAFVVLLGLLDRRMKHIADAKGHLPQVSRLLGVLPSLPDKSNDPHQTAIAAHCVHQIRTLLQIQQSSNGRRVLAVTSPSPGDGKTSLVIALGISYAATGAKTLLIDCDAHGRALTARLAPSAACRLGQILLRSGNINAQQLEMAVERAASRGIRLGEALIDQGLVSAIDVKHSLSAQARMRAGLSGVMEGASLADSTVDTGTPNLHVLRFGMDDGLDPSTLGPAAVRAMLDEAAREFDNVLIDTGPILGSLEAAVVASEADGVVLAISRGGQRNLAQNALNYLHTMNANIEGTVFNRARPEDIIRSGYSTSVPMVSPRQYDATANGKSTGRRLGPVAQAVTGPLAIREGKSSKAN